MCSSLSTRSKTSSVERTNFIYARVSSKKQLDDLSRQVEFIKGRRSEYSSYKLVTDIASGINFKRKGLETILDACVQNNIGEVVVAHRDRLSRFGYDLIELLVKKAGVSITVIDDERETKHLNKNYQKTCYQLSTSTVVGKWVKEATKQKTIIKSLKINPLPGLMEHFLFIEQ